MTIFVGKQGIRHEVSFVSRSPSYVSARCGLRIKRRKGKPQLKEAVVTCLECIAAQPPTTIDLSSSALTKSTLETAMQLIRDHGRALK